MEMTKEQQEMLRAMFMEQGRREKQQKVERYRRLNKFVKPGQILFVGSSLMEQFPVNELTMDLGLNYTVYNRGIGGFTTQELAQVLDVCVLDLKPKHIFINIGTNDLNDDPFCLEAVMGRYEDILLRIKEALPQAKLYLLAYYPVNEPVGLSQPFMGEVFRRRTNARIRQANEGVKALAQKLGAAYYDFNAGITDEAGNQKSEYTVEGMHMYADGYMQVLKAMLPVLEALK